MSKKQLDKPNTHKVKWDQVIQCYIVIPINIKVFIGEFVPFIGTKDQCEKEATRLNNQLN